MTKYIPHERGRILRRVALPYYLNMYKHEIAKMFDYYASGGLACYNARAMTRNENLHGGNFDGQHQLGYYKQGAN